MNNNRIKVITTLSILVAVLMMFTQYLWMSKAHKIADEDFDRKVVSALKDVGENLYRSNYKEFIAHRDIVKKKSESYYIVRVDNKIDYVSSLKELLKRELTMQGIKTVFEYGVYDCESDKMKKGERIDMTGSQVISSENPKQFAKINEESYNYYFGVNFPERDKYVKGQLNYIYLSTALLVLFLGWLGYIIFIVFKQKRLQEIQRDFVNNMTHEFKTPLSTIQIASEVLKNPNIVNNPQRLLNYATIISNESAHLTTQVERVLQMASTERGSLILRKSTFTMSELLEEIISKYRHLLRTKGGDININIDKENETITADRLHIRNLISNLIDNAIKYSEPERPPIIDLTISGKSDNQLEIKVKDNGIGIPEEHVKYIFDKFFRVPTGNIHNVKGFGLGLSYVKLIAKKHGGDAFCKSILGKGTEFTIFMPKS
jgi:two-component system, OmpR family, phosphate regulon sensor histidine kinase PhoR